MKAARNFAILALLALALVVLPGGSATLGTVLTVLSAWKLRRTRPAMPRSFAIPGGNVGLFYVVAAPLVMAILALLGSDRFGMIGGAIALALGPVVYKIVARGSP